MAKKKYEFKPDPTGSGLLTHLYLTRSQRLSLAKWALDALVLLALLLIQDVIMSRFSLLGATTELVAAGILIVCLTEGAEKGGVFALAASVVYVFSGSSPGEYSIVLLTAVGVLGTVVRQAYFHRSFASTKLCAGLMLLLYEAAVWAVCLVLGQVPARAAAVFALRLALTLPWLPALYPIVRSIGKIGGEPWKE